MKRLAVLTALLLALWSSVAGAADRTPPTRPTGLSATAASSTEIDLRWSPSSDNLKVTGYVVYRNGNRLTSVTGTVSSDLGLKPSTRYSYQVAAFDAAGNLSSRSSSVSAITLSTPPTTTTTSTTTTSTTTTTTTSTTTTTTSTTTTTLPVNVTHLSACSNISTSGSYVLDADVSANNVTCMTIHDAAAVTLDCAGHTVAETNTNAPVMALSNLNGFTIRNCTVNPGAFTVGLQIDTSTGGLLSHNTFTGQAIVNLNSTNATTVDTNAFLPGIYQQAGSTGNTVTNNRFGGITQNVCCLVNSASGASNMIASNTIDGQGAVDDGIVVQWESKDHVDNNNVANVYDCGIETLGLIQTSTFSGNMISNAKTCAIGGWFNASWLGDTANGNQSTNSGPLFEFYRINALAGNETAVYFQNNTFSNNTVVSLFNTPFPVYIDMAPADAQPPLPASEFVLGNNRFTNNTFGTFESYPPFILPVSMVVDGGGNQCVSGTSVNPGFACHS
jgi:hypothetical protein